jgi:hypothetical protein
VARTILEAIAFWALHRHFDPSPQPVDDNQVRRALVDLLTRGMVGTER